MYGGLKPNKKKLPHVCAVDVKSAKEPCYKYVILISNLGKFYKVNIAVYFKEKLHNKQSNTNYKEKHVTPASTEVNNNVK